MCMGGVGGLVNTCLRTVLNLLYLLCQRRLAAPPLHLSLSTWQFSVILILLGERRCRGLSGLPVLDKKFLKEWISLSANGVLLFCIKPLPISSHSRELVSEALYWQLCCFPASISCYLFLDCTLFICLGDFFFLSACTCTRSHLTTQLVGAEFWLAVCRWVRIWSLCNMLGAEPVLPVSSLVVSGSSVDGSGFCSVSYSTKPHV